MPAPVPVTIATFPLRRFPIYFLILSILNGIF
jgi:hypothetical protein